MCTFDVFWFFISPQVVVDITDQVHVVYNRLITNVVLNIDTESSQSFAHSSKAAALSQLFTRKQARFINM